VRKLLVFLGAAWIAANLAGAVLATSNKRPYDLSFLSTPGKSTRIGQDFLFGWGTGLSLPLGVLAAAGILTVVASFGHQAGRIAAFLLMLVGAGSIAFTFSNQLTYDRIGVNDNRDFPGETATITATLLLAAMLVFFGFLTVLTTPRHHRH